MSTQAMLDALAPILAVVARVDVNNPAAAKAMLTRELPLTNPAVVAVRALFKQGVSEGWLCNKEGGGAKFSRLAKQSPETKNLSIDAVRMSGPGVWHKHTGGEIDLCFANNPGATFDKNPEGWVVFGPNSEHVPTVASGEMDILYFLPGGQIEWKRA